MLELIRGQKVKLSDITPSLLLEVGLSITLPPGRSIDISCFGLDANGKLSDDRYFIFYNQKSSPCGALVAQGARAGDNEVFDIALGTLPSTIRRLVFTATLDGEGSLADLGASHLQLMVSGQSLARFSFSGSLFGGEKAAMIGELYLKDIWRFAVIGQGFNGGLSALLAHFGGSETPAAPPVAPPPPPVVPVAPPVVPPAPPRPVAPPPPVAPVVAPPVAPPSAPVNLGKVTLEKRGARQAVNLKKGGGTQPIHINLNWDKPKPKTGFLSMLAPKPQAPDLDVGCMFVMKNGLKGVIQPLGGNFGSKTADPYIYLDKDDRSGASVDGENLFIFRPDLIEKVMIFALLFEGAARFSDVNARLIIKDHVGSEILINLDNPEQNLRFCTICMIEQRGDKIEITKEERYFPSHSQADERYGFGFLWKAGSK